MLTTRRRLLFDRAGGRGWSVAGVGVVKTLAALGAAVNANPSADVTQLGPYDARRDVVIDAVITEDYVGGTFDFARHRIRNLTITSTRNDQVPGRPVGIGFFHCIDGGTVENFNIDVSIRQLGARNVAAPGPPEAMVYRVGGLYGYLFSGTVRNGHVDYDIFVNGNLGYNGGVGGDKQDTGIQTGVTSRGTMSCSVDAYNTYMAPMVAVVRGSGAFSDNHVLGATITAPTGTTNYVTLESPTATPSAATGSWIGGHIGQLGYYTQEDTVVTGCTSSGVSLTNSTGQNVANYTGGFAPIELACEVEDCHVWNLIINGANSTGGFIGQQRNGPDGTDPDASIARLCSVDRATVNGRFSYLGGFVGSATGTLDAVFSTAIVTMLTAGGGNTAGIAGAVQPDAEINDVAFYGRVNGGTGVGGIFGWMSVSGADAVALLSVGSVRGTSIVGAIAGFDNHDAGVVDAYYNSDTSGVSRAAGNQASPADMTARTTVQLKAALPTGFDSGVWTRDAGAVLAEGYPYLQDMPVPTIPAALPTKRLVINVADSGSIAKPADWNDTDNEITAVGPGGNGGTATTLTGGGGGGGGAWGRRLNYAWLAGNLTVTVTAGGSEVDVTVMEGATTLLSIDAGKNASGSVAGAGGTSAGSTAPTKFGGGNGNTGNSRAGAGGGSGGGEFGAGKAGSGGGSNGSSSGGGGGAGRGAAGTAGSTTSGGTGGVGYTADVPVTASFTASIASNVLTVTAVSAGGLVPTQVISPSGATIIEQLTDTAGAAGSTGTYQLTATSDAGSAAMTATTPSQAAAGGAGSTSHLAAGADGTLDSGGGGGRWTSASGVGSAGGAGGTGDPASADAGGGGAGGGGGESATAGAGGAGGVGAGGGGGGRGTSPGAGGSGGDGRVVFIWRVAA